MMGQQSYVSRDLQTADVVKVQHDAIRVPLVRSYEGPYLVLS